MNYARPAVITIVAGLAVVCVSAGCKRGEKPAAQPASITQAQPTTQPAAQAATRPASVPGGRPLAPALARGIARGIRGIWVTRMDYKTAEDITAIMENCRQAGFNHVLFQVRGNGTVFYPSRIEPWAEQFGFQSPGFDPLALACREAHARGLTLHAWVNVMPGWRGIKAPSIPEQLYNQRPEWFWYDQKGRRQPLVDKFYVSLNPCLPEVRAYLVSVFREIVTNYDIDALHMDYVRFPNEPPVIPAGSGLDYPRDARTLALYQEATGKAPDDDTAAWNQWRTQQVTRLVEDIRVMMGEIRPAAMLTASLGTDRKASLAHFRDDAGWVNAGLIDIAFPMDYKPDVEKFVAGMRPWLPQRERVTVVPGLWTVGGAGVAHGQIQAAIEATGNFCLFAYASLYESRAETTPAEAAARVVNRQALVPFIQGLTASRPAI
jgi:uncharacterized lipoprotein YddW (UPF0748 family)